jgi:hypothetical protein
MRRNSGPALALVVVVVGLFCGTADAQSVTVNANRRINQQNGAEETSPSGTLVVPSTAPNQQPGWRVVVDYGEFVNAQFTMWNGGPAALAFLQQVPMGGGPINCGDSPATLLSTKQAVLPTCTSAQGLRRT